jgi:signal transduction histidine kinase
LLAGLIVVLLSTSLLASLLLVSRNGVTSTVLALWRSMLITSSLYILNRSGRYRLAAILFVTHNFLVIFLSTVLTRDPSWLMFSSMVVIFSAMLLPRLSFIVYILGIVTHVVLGNFFPVSGTLTNFGGTVSYSILGPLILVFMAHRAGLERERQEELRAANEALKRSEAELEIRVAARTRDLKLASDVARQTTTILDLEKLLPQLVDQTKAAFNLHFVSIFLYEPETNRLVLAAGTDEAGRKMLAEGVGFRLDARPSLVAQTARERQSIVFNDVAEAESHAKNPYLPETRSEAGFPMYVGDELVGVMGTQSQIVNRFGPDDVEIFSTLAEQIAIAVKNAQLFESQKRLAEELLKADQTKSQFLASMSHELRTPLNAIINFTEMVAAGMMGPVNEEQAGLLNQSLESSQHLLHLINDVLDISKIQAGQLALFVENNVDLQAELKSAVAMVEPLLNGKPVSLVQDIDQELPVMTADKRRIRQIVLNLLTNAVKFTDEGSITLSVKKQGDQVLLAVADTGPGISREMQTVIFEPFLQTEDGLKHAQGTGLGLPITRSLVTAHGGQLWLESEPGEGAAFFVKLPVNGASPAAVPAEAAV